MDADVMLVGEIPGDEEDRQGRPFVGPAGKLLDRTLVDVGLCRSDVYLTNVVKHFSWQPRGKRRLHKKPRRIEVLSCRAWIDAELLIVRPKVVVCLGATAAQVLLGNKYRISRHRGEVVSFVSAGLDTSIAAVASWHPSAILRARTSLSRSKMQAELAMDLRRARDAALSAR